MTTRKSFIKGLGILALATLFKPFVFFNKKHADGTHSVKPSLPFKARKDVRSISHRLS